MVYQVTHAAKAQPARTRFHSTDLACDVVRTYAYRAVCACGWRSDKVYASHADARRAAREHRLAELGLD